jgi:hypothetical protein
MGTSEANLYVNHADHATAYCFWVARDSIDTFIAFVDEVNL